MNFIDTHCHFTDEQFGQENEAALERALEAGVYKMIQADISSEERPAMLEFTERHPGVVYAMAGLYPGAVKPDTYMDELDLAWKAAQREGTVAVGEIGLEYHYAPETAAQQMDALRTQLEFAAKLDLPVNIHLREATDDFFKVLDSCRGLALRGNLHAFSTSAQVFRRVQKYGDWYVGIGGVVTFKNAGIAKELADIPLERIILETDAPYLAPTPLRGTRNESSNIPLIARKIAEIKGVSEETVAQTTTATALSLFERIQ